MGGLGGPTSTMQNGVGILQPPPRRPLSGHFGFPSGRYPSIGCLVPTSQSRMQQIKTSCTTQSVGERPVPQQLALAPVRTLSRMPSLSRSPPPSVARSEPAEWARVTSTRLVVALDAHNDIGHVVSEKGTVACSRWLSSPCRRPRRSCMRVDRLPPTLHIATTTSYLVEADSFGS